MHGYLAFSVVLMAVESGGAVEGCVANGDAVFAEDTASFSKP